MMGEAAAISSLLVASGLLSLAVWVAARERWRGVGLQFAALCLLLAEWLACAGLTMGVATAAAAEPWARASWLGVGLVPAALYRAWVSEGIATGALAAAAPPRQLDVRVGDKDTTRAVRPVTPGLFAVLGVPPHDVQFAPLPLILGRQSIVMSPVGSRAQIKAMLEFSARHRIVPQVEVFPMREVNGVYRRLASNELRYRAVLANAS